MLRRRVLVGSLLFILKDEKTFTLLGSDNRFSKGFRRYGYRVVNKFTNQYPNGLNPARVPF
jgi:hypothetical protein